MNPLALTVAIVALFIALCVAFPLFWKVALVVLLTVLAMLGAISLSGSMRLRAGRREQ